MCYSRFVGKGVNCCYVACLKVNIPVAFNNVPNICFAKACYNSRVVWIKGDGNLVGMAVVYPIMGDKLVKSVSCNKLYGFSLILNLSAFCEQSNGAYSSRSRYVFALLHDAKIALAINSVRSRFIAVLVRLFFASSLWDC